MSKIVTVVGSSPTLFHAVQKDYRMVVRQGSSYVDGMPGGYVHRWAENGNAVQVFGSWIGGSGGALHWDEDAVRPVDKARQIARDLRIRFLNEAGFAAWKAQQEARPVRGDLLFVSQDDGDEHWCELNVNWHVPYMRRGTRIAYRDASGTYEVTSEDFASKDGGPVRSLYTLTRDDVVQARVERPYCENDRVGLLVDAFRAALAAA